MNELSTKSLRIIRVAVQWCFLMWVVGIGIRFGMFVNSVERGATSSLVSRPPGVEGFLPIGALTSLKYLLVFGKIHPVHPAAVVFIFMAGIGAGIVSGHWQSSLIYSDYQRLIPLIKNLSH